MTRRRWPRCVLTAAGAALALAWGSDAAAEPVRLLVSVGHRYGLPAERPLKFANTDAARVRDVLVAMGGVRPEHAVVLTEPSPAELLRTLDRIGSEAKKRRPEEVTLMFYFSGHGDREALHLGDARLPISEVSSRLGQIPAALRIVVTDACRATRDKGLSAEAAFPISLGAMPHAQGSVWLHAASDGEAAQESDDLQGAIFTHAWLNGLRGAADANGDARVTLDEAFAFAHSQTVLRSAKSSGVLQKPEAVVSITETQPVVLTQTASRLAFLSLPPSPDTHYLVYASGAKSVLAEIWGSPERRTALAVPPGRYVVHRRVSGRGGLAQLAVSQGEERQLEGPDFTTTSLEALARKGGGADEDRAEAPPKKGPPANEITGGYGFGTSARSRLVQGPQVAYARVLGSWAVTIGGVLETSTTTTTATTEKTTAPIGRVTFGPRWVVGRVTIHGGAGARAGAVFQTVSRVDAAELARGGYSGETKSSAFVWGPEARLGARIATAAAGAPFAAFLDVEGTANATMLQEAGTTRFVPGAFGGASLGATF